MTPTRFLLTWLLLAVLMPLNGALRELGFKRIMSATAAEWLSAATGIAIILTATRLFFRIPADATTSQLVRWSAILVALTVFYEFGVGWMSGKPLREAMANYAIWEGRLWPLVLAALALTPWLWRGRG